MAVWGTFILDAFAPAEAVGVRDGLEQLLGPESMSAWSTGGVYVFWDFKTREPLYVGIAGDLPVRFAQHLGLRSAPADGCKREQIAGHFDEGHDKIGYTVIALSGLSQPATARQKAALALKDRELIALNKALGKEATRETRGLEGRLIAAHRAKTGELPRWNVDPGQIPQVVAGSRDMTLAVATGTIDLLLQARRTIRGLADDGLAGIFEAHLHAIRMLAVAEVFRGGALSNETIRERVRSFPASPEVREEILRSGYLDQPCPLGPRATGTPSE